MDRPWPRGTGSTFFIWSSIWATLLSFFSIRRRSEKSASRERERGQNTHGARMKGGAQKHWRQNGFHSHSGGRPEVPYFFLARLFAIISGLLSSLQHGTLSHIKAVHTRSTSACEKLVCWGGAGHRMQICTNPRFTEVAATGTTLVVSAQTVDWTRQVTPRDTGDTQTRAGRNKRLAALRRRVWNYVSVHLISVRVPPGRHCRAAVMNKHY